MNRSWSRRASKASQGEANVSYRCRLFSSIRHPYSNVPADTDPNPDCWYTNSIIKQKPSNPVFFFFFLQRGRASKGPENDQKTQLYCTPQVVFFCQGAYKTGFLRSYVMKRKKRGRTLTIATGTMANEFVLIFLGSPGEKTTFHLM